MRLFLQQFPFGFAFDRWRLSRFVIHALLASERLISVRGRALYLIGGCRKFHRESP